jgi:CRP-like cAMP-binding protein
MTIPETHQLIIQNITDVVPLSDDQIELILSVLEPKNFRKKEFVLLAGDVCHYETFVNKGCLKVFYTDPEGVDHNVKFAIENWWSLDLESFEMQTSAFYSIQAIEDSSCFQISKANHDRLYEQIPTLEKFARLRYQNSYIMLQHRMTQNLFSTAEEKYNAFTKKYPGLELRISQKEIASYLGITPEFLSMLRNRRAAVQRSLT